MYSLAAQRIVLFVGYLFNSNAICHGTLHHTHRVGKWMCGLSLGLYTYTRHRVQISFASSLSLSILLAQCLDTCHLCGELPNAPLVPSRCIAFLSLRHLYVHDGHADA